MRGDILYDSYPFLSLDVATHVDSGCFKKVRHVFTNVFSIFLHCYKGHYNVVLCIIVLLLYLLSYFSLNLRSDSCFGLYKFFMIVLLLLNFVLQNNKDVILE